MGEPVQFAQPTRSVPKLSRVTEAHTEKIRVQEPRADGPLDKIDLEFCRPVSHRLVQACGRRYAEPRPDVEEREIRIVCNDRETLHKHLVDANMLILHDAIAAPEDTDDFVLIRKLARGFRATPMSRAQIIRCFPIKHTLQTTAPREPRVMV